MASIAHSKYTSIPKSCSRISYAAISRPRSQLSIFLTSFSKYFNASVKVKRTDSAFASGKVVNIQRYVVLSIKVAIALLLSFNSSNQLPYDLIFLFPAQTV